MSSVTADDNASALEPVTGHVELASDGDNMIVTGSPTAVERFLHAYGLTPSAEALGPQTLGRLARLGSVAAQASSSIAAESGRWLKLTAELAQDPEDRHDCVALTPQLVDERADQRFRGSSSPRRKSRPSAGSRCLPATA